MKKICYSFIMLTLCLLGALSSEAQSWQWGKRGGDKGGTSSDEEVRSIATDQNGNNYILAYVYSDKLTGDIDVDGNKLGKGNNGTDLCLVSFDCAGKFRWSKVIGGRYTDVACDVRVDTLGGVYVAGNFFAMNMFDSVAIDKDTMLHSPTVTPYRIYKSLFVLKFDTLGKYQWLRMPEPDTISVSKYSRAVAMEVDQSGNISMMTCINHSGAFAKGSYVVPTAASLPAMHILKYDRDGNFTSGFLLDITEGVQASLFRLRMAWDTKNHVYYILSVNGGDPSVTDQPKFGSIKMTGTNCLAKFSSSGSNLWVKQSSSSYYASVTGVPKLDAEGNVYIGCSDKVGQSFGGYTFTNTMSASAVPVILKLRPSDGNVIWGHCINSDYSAGGTAVEVAPDGTVGFTTVSLRTISIGPYTSYSAGTAMNIALIRFDQNTGALKGFDTLNASNSGVVEIMASDRNSNFYLGGYIDAQLKIIGVDTLVKYGGRNDFFVIKYGEANCSDPVSVTEHQLAYADIKVYPNPAQNMLNIEGLPSGATVHVLNMLGQELIQQTVRNNKEQINVDQLSTGLYMLQVRDKEGGTYSTKFVKQ